MKFLKDSNMNKEDKQILEKMFADGNGYGDPEARLNDDRKFNYIIAKQQQKIQRNLNWLTFFMVLIGVINIFILLFKIGK